MSHNPYIARVAGDAFDADQIESDDPFYQTDAEWARAKAQADAASAWNANFNARKAAKLAAKGWTVTVRDLGAGRAELAA